MADSKTNSDSGGGQRDSAESLRAFLQEYRKRSNSIVVMSHYNPDADAYGSSCGLALALKNVGFTVRCVNESGVDPRLSFIPGVGEVVSDFGSTTPEVIVVCDCGDRGRTGDRLQHQLDRFPILVNIDHHISNDFFGQRNVVVPTASSTSELIYDLLEGWPGAMSKEVAECLYAGIVADTGSFRYASTSARTFAIAGALLSYGAQPAEIAQAMFGQERLVSLKLFGEGIAKLEMLCGGRVAIMMLTHEMYQAAHAGLEDSESFVERVRDIAGVQVAVVAKEDRSGPEPLWRVSLRSRQPACDVGAVAAAFGGGGHRMAAAFRWRRTGVDLRQALDKALEAMIADAAPKSNGIA